MDKLKIGLPIFFVVLYTAIILFSSTLLKTRNFISVSRHEYFNFQFNSQICLLIITALSLIITYYLNKESLMSYFSFGNIAAPTHELKIFGIKADDNWAKTGVSLTLFISLATGLFMYFQFNQIHVNWAMLQNGFIWIILFSLSNSFGEEMIYRMGIVAPLKGLLSPMSIFIISSILFGLPHLAGMPSGLIGATMASILGFVLAKSLYETNGFFWAWLIHFIQDVIIIGSLFLLSETK